MTCRTPETVVKIILTADIHAGIPGKIDDCIWSLDLIYKYAKKNDINHIFIMGDLFHDRDHINIEVSNKVYDFFNNHSDIQWLVFIGNHDMFLKNSWRINSVRPLNKLITVIEDISLVKIGNARFWIAPFIHYESVYMKLIKELDEKCKPDDILLTHIGVNSAELNVCFLHKNWNIIELDNTNFYRIYAGHFHCHQQVGDKLWYAGSPIPFRYDEGIVEHGFIVYDTDEREHDFVPTYDIAHKYGVNHIPPDYITITDDNLSDQNKLSGNNVRIALSREYSNNELTEIQSNLRQQGANEITFRYPKDKREEIADLGQTTVQTDELFEAWVDHDDKSKKYKKDLLLKLNKELLEAVRADDPEHATSKSGYISIKTLEFRNFMSYGDYPTKLSVDAIGPALICGWDADKQRSNGAGKTTPGEAILWCLFGRISAYAQPGDNIVNWQVGKDCYVEITTTDGYKIRRTRKMSGHYDLLIYKPDGTDISSSTNPNAQKELQELLGIDYGKFCSSIMFSQFGNSLLELSEQRRRAILEDLMTVSHLQTYAEHAKNRLKKLEAEQEKQQYKRDTINDHMRSLAEQIKKCKDKENNYESDRKEQLDEARIELDKIKNRHDSEIEEKQEFLETLQEQLSALKCPSDAQLKELKDKWNTIDKIKSLINSKLHTVNQLETDKRIISNKIRDVEGVIREWQQRAGRMCVACGQEISEGHAKSKIEPLKKIISDHKSEIKELDLKIDSNNKTIKLTEDRLEAAKPDRTVESLESDINQVKQSIRNLDDRINNVNTDISTLKSNRDDDIQAARGRLEKIREQANPYVDMVKDLTAQLKKKHSEFKDIDNKLRNTDILTNHMSYIRSAYSDRKKIKAFLIANSISFLNARIAHYIQSFKMSCGLVINSFLQIDMDEWPYYLRSGGEKRSIDLAIMFALYDLHVSRHGQLCNVLIFDEVDGRLDSLGIECFVDILRNNYIDRPNSPKTILVISHREEMRDAFPTKILVEKKDKLSYIKEIC